jgi:hypothetical protein
MYFFGAPEAAADRRLPEVAERVADFILDLQDAAGAIRDEPGGGVVNEDSNMEYALMGMAAAYAYSQDPRYLSSLERGIDWLAKRQATGISAWRGSWFYAYAKRPPYRPVAISPGADVEDVRGVDSTGALFVYLLYLHQQATGSDRLAQRYAQNARNALDFIIAANRSKDGLFYNAWHKRKQAWKPWKYSYAADQADVYLGLRAGGLLYDDHARQYGKLAWKLRKKALRTFVKKGLGHYAVGRETDGGLDEGEGFDVSFAQTYLPWVFGPAPSNDASYRWFREQAWRSGDTVVLPDGTPTYSLIAATFELASQALGQPGNPRFEDWLLTHVIDRDGGVRDTPDRGSEKYSNVAGFTLLALLKRKAWPSDP